MVATMLQNTGIAWKAEHYLSVQLGVTRLLPVLWEVVMDEARVIGSHWTERDLARRYLSLLRDHTRASTIDPDLGSEYGLTPGR